MKYHSRGKHVNHYTTDFEIFNEKSCILSISERVLMFENKYFLLSLLVVVL